MTVRVNGFDYPDIPKAYIEEGVEAAVATEFCGVPCALLSRVELMALVGLFVLEECGVEDEDEDEDSQEEAVIEK